MEQIQITSPSKGVWTSDVRISTEEWTDILSNAEVTTSNYKEALLAFYNEPGHKSTCKALSMKHYGTPKEAQKFNSWITSFGKAVVKHLNRFQIVDTDGKERYWHVTMCSGRDREDGLFETTLRPELVSAIEVLGWNRRLTWIPYYVEMADKLSQYKDNRKPLLDIIYALDKKSVGYIKAVDGGHVSDIDPFTVYGIFNRGITNDNRIKLCHYFKEKLNIEAPVPTDFDGIPVVNNMMATFYWRENETTDIQPLWNLFTSVLADDEEKVKSCFDIVTSQQGIKWNITMGLYWIRPYEYISLDSRNRDYLPSLGIDVFKDREIDAAHYWPLLESIKEKIASSAIKEKNIPEISYQAWISDSGVTTEPEPGKNYWLVGHAFSSTDSQFKRFVQDGIWEGRFDETTTVNQRQLGLVRRIKAGDVIMLKSTAVKQRSVPFLRVKAVGIVTDQIEESEDKEYKTYRCRVNYLSLADKDFDGPSFGAYRQTVHLADENASTIIEYANSIIEERMKTKPKYHKYIDLLKECHNLVLTGAPGTGKTYMAHEIAREMGAEVRFVQFHPSYDYTDFVEGLRPKETADGQIGFERRDGTFKDFCKDAIKNLEDSKKSRKELTEENSLKKRYDRLIDNIENGVITEINLKTGGKVMEIVKISDFNNIILRTPGTTSEKTYTVSFDRIAKLAKAYPDTTALNDITNINEAVIAAIGGCHTSSYWAVLNEVYRQDIDTDTTAQDHIEKRDYVFIIDEINRGEASKIFGELFYAIDPGYRGKKDLRVQTQYQNLVPDTDLFAEGFYVPENVYILATMNDIDRSVESMDFAMRRRFVWKEVTPDDTKEMLDILESEADNAKAVMKRLNDRISSMDGLGSAYQIGPSYFLRLKKNGNDYGSLWNMSLEPLLKEYLRGTRKADELLRDLHDAYLGKDEVEDPTDIIDED